MTHAFFKGLLFLAAGSVIHAMGGEQDMRTMGGLRKKIPFTYLDDVYRHARDCGRAGLCRIFQQGRNSGGGGSGPHANLTLWLLGLVGAGLTSFYMFRLIFLTFFGKPRYDEHKVHVHESPRNMTVPLMFLAFLSIFGGWFAAPHLVGGTDYFEAFLHPVFAAYRRQLAAEQSGVAGG